MTSTPINKNETCTRKAQCHAKELFAIDREENTDNCFPLNLLIVLREQQKEPRNIKFSISTYISDRGSGYFKQELDDIKIIYYDSKINIPQSLRRRVLDWYHFYINHPGGSRLDKIIWEVCYWKGLFTQADLFANICKTCQQFKKRKTLYGHLPPKNTAELKPWDSVHIDLIGPYSKSIRQQHPGGGAIWKNASLTCMEMIDPASGWFAIVSIPTFYLEEVRIGNDEYIDKSSARFSQLFNNTWLCRYPHPRKVVFDNSSEFKQ